MRQSIRRVLMRSVRDGSAVLIIVVLIIAILLIAGVDLTPWD